MNIINFKEEMILVSTVNFSYTIVGQCEITSEWAPFNQEKSAHIPLTVPGIYILPANGQEQTKRFRHCVKGFKSI